MIQIGSKLNQYEILRHIGAGGMGEVYEALDSRLERKVALKLIRSDLSMDAERIIRFEREAKVLASLNHLNIAAIYGLEESGSSRFLVMELARGETLAARIARGAVPMEEALKIAKQIAMALETAHERGVTHRDLKPANIMVSAEGQVKVLDFGLAKAVSGDTSELNLSNSPTVVTANTGMILGTAGYMSPEQAKGKVVDRATDVWAFGCVLFEMLAGRPTFEGETIGEVLGSVFRAEPEWKYLPAETPLNIRRLLRRCLRKDVQQRLHDVHDIRIELEEPDSDLAASSPLPPASRRGERVVWVSVVSVLLVVSLLALFKYRSATNQPSPEYRLEITTPPTTDPLSFALSPDGQNMVFVASFEGRPRLWLRRLDSVSMKPVPGTDYATMPFWSPDSRSVGFFLNGVMRTLDVESGSIQPIIRLAVPAGAAWNRDNAIIFPGAPDYPLLRVSSKGGAMSPIPNLVPRDAGHRDPQFLPDNNHFLYYVAGDSQSRGIYIGELNGGGARRLLEADASAVYAPPGRLLFIKQGTLFAQLIDSKTWELSGAPVPVAQEVAYGGVASSAAISASAAGPIAYRTGSSGGKRQLVWIDRTGKEVGKIGEAHDFGPAYLSMSPNGQQLAVQRGVQGNADIWLLDLVRGGALRFTTAPQPEITPVWSPDGRKIVFSGGYNGQFDLYLKGTDGTASELLLSDKDSKQATDWSRDGRYILYRNITGAATNIDIWALPLDGDKKPIPLVRTPFEERDAQFSPDGKWIAYQSNESGRFEIYMQPFPGPGAPLPISTGGGAQVRWRSDGTELFYIAPDGNLMTVSMQTDSSGIPKPGNAVRLFLTHVGAVEDISPAHYLPSSDGQKFLMDTIVEENAAPITVIVNWKPPSK
jgi:eukaryotic-like serine/threonine-protein kinase